MKKYLEKIYKDAINLNHQNILELLEKNRRANFLDLGCADGDLSIKVGKQIGTANIYGVEIMSEAIKESMGKGIRVKKFDLNKRFDFKDDFFDVILANQVIEHLYSSDNFLSEIYRILKVGGYAIISTENASSWCNIFASIMGWQIFSLTNISDRKQGIGNPLALHKGFRLFPGTMKHIRIFNIYGLKEYFETFGFRVEKIKGAGYFPFPAWVGNIDKTHSHFITFKIRKAEQ